MWFKFPISALKNFALALLGLQFFVLTLELYPHKLSRELTIRCTSVVSLGCDSKCEEEKGWLGKVNIELSF